MCVFKWDGVRLVHRLRLRNTDVNNDITLYEDHSEVGVVDEVKSPARQLQWDNAEKYEKLDEIERKSELETCLLYTSPSPRD